MKCSHAGQFVKDMLHIGLQILSVTKIKIMFCYGYVRKSKRYVVACLHSTRIALLA